MSNNRAGIVKDPVVAVAVLSNTPAPLIVAVTVPLPVAAGAVNSTSIMNIHAAQEIDRDMPVSP